MLDRVGFYVIASEAKQSHGGIMVYCIRMKSLRQKLYRALFPVRNVADIKRKYGMPDLLNLVVRVDENGWFVVQVPELKGLVTQARSMDELVEMVNDAVLCYFDVPRREADVVYDLFQIGDRVLEYRGQLQTQPA